MIKRALPAVLGFLSLCLPLVAQQAEDAASTLSLYQPDIFSTIDSSILIHGLPVPTLLDARRFPASNELARMGMVPRDLFPIALVSAVQAPEVSASSTRDTDSLGELESLRLNRGLYTSGEMGFLYGTTTGKFGYETKQSYIMGTVGNDKFQITAGASYQDSSWRIPRQGVLAPPR